MFNLLAIGGYNCEFSRLKRPFSAHYWFRRRKPHERDTWEAEPLILLGSRALLELACNGHFLASI